MRAKLFDAVPVVGAHDLGQFFRARRAISKAYAAEVPYVIALIELDEGPTMMSNVVELDPESVAIGLPVEVTFEDWSDEITIPKFRPSGSTEDAG